MSLFVTVADLRDYLDLGPAPTGSPDTVLVNLVAAVETAVTGSHDVPGPFQPEEVDGEPNPLHVPAPPADAVQGVLMQCARLYRRRFTPEGISTFGTDFALRVNRFDPDIDALLDRYKRWSLA